MKHVTMTVAVMIGLGACAPLKTYYKPGADITAVQRQTTACEVEALAKVPVSTQIRRAPPRFIPPREICNSAGRCRVLPGYYEPGAVYTVDPNVDLRNRVESQCMADQGFVPVSIPACPSAVAQAAPQRATTTLPPLNDKSCVIRNDDGSFQIVTRG
ncbi:hypothetical protein [uncultured Sulfitobacter sp.]|jgi:hypothetical protein|uniref:hypothetical protein n=1 Tax=uncultured Sulfitobacter sp. TaxID=191468 RepID=UPI0030F56ED6